MNTAPHLDTYVMITQLKGSGFTEQQARGIADVVCDITHVRLATKADFHDLALAIKTGMENIHAHIGRLDKRIDELDTRMQIGFRDLEYRLTNKMAAMGLAAVGFLTAVKFFG